MERKKKRDTILESALYIFAKNGFYKTTIAQIAKFANISVGGIYRYFSSKELLAKESIGFITKTLSKKLQKINVKNISSKEKIELFVELYLDFLEKHPEMMEFFFKIYLSHKELFCKDNGCGFELAKEFIEEVEKLVNEGIEKNEFRKQSFFVAFSSIVGILGGITFLNSEGVLENNLIYYKNDLANSINKALS